MVKTKSWVIKDTEKAIKQTVKEYNEGTKDFIDKFLYTLPKFVKHMSQAKNQWKKQLAHREALLHIDFSQKFSVQVNRDRGSSFRRVVKVSIIAHLCLIQVLISNLEIIKLLQDIPIWKKAMKELCRDGNIVIYKLNKVSDNLSTQSKNKS